MTRPKKIQPPKRQCDATIANKQLPSYGSRCTSEGTIRVGDRWYCQRHLRQAQQRGSKG